MSSRFLALRLEAGTLLDQPQWVNHIARLSHAQMLISAPGKTTTRPS
jgi:hypothetical protein